MEMIEDGALTVRISIDAFRHPVWTVAVCCMVKNRCTGLKREKDLRNAGDPLKSI
jgi:hypothetical protein